MGNGLDGAEVRSLFERAFIAVRGPAGGAADKWGLGATNWLRSAKQKGLPIW